MFGGGKSQRSVGVTRSSLIHFYHNLGKKNQLFPSYRHVPQHNSRSESKYGIHVTDGAREALLRLMGGV